MVTGSTVPSWVLREGTGWALGGALPARRAAISASLDFDDWMKFLGNKHMVTALLSRLRHQCTAIRIDDPSLRGPLGSASMSSPRRSAERRTLGSARSHGPRRRDPVLTPSRSAPHEWSTSHEHRSMTSPCS